MAGPIGTRLSKAGFTHPVESVVLPDTSHYVLTNLATMPRVVAFFRRSLGN